ncbi:BREX-2 system phosphatase PglZ [Spirulina major CS-329]|uniref:BREX-2 system phosphatase PglZ n=1 Tax=Spirulina TaxID=1154 RepID=UPI00232D3921|nr:MULTISPECIES: BREX-2 system phosphatase PglZ [Spirulina]MDB9493506.1 BREX-2 system phosphatase PglZ [Spirulina subsalsa CS-330]MDB9501549.1 BREX-2 system phosphatase PglZ [Spirulina major CS-329]
MTRVAKRRLFPIDPWQSVAEHFGAQILDPRLRAYAWLADYLLSDPSNDRYRVPAGVLDAETVWSIVLNRELKITDERPDLQSLLEWSLNPQAIANYQHLDPNLKTIIHNRLIETAGNTVSSLLTYLDCGERSHPIAMGIVLDVLFHPDNQGKCDRAIGKLEERYFQGQALDASTLKPWQTVTARLLKQDPALFTTVQHPVDELLQELGVDAYADVSHLSKTGFEQRLQQWGEHLNVLLQTDSQPWTEANFVQLQEAFQKLLSSQAYTPTSRLALSLTMAMRLVQWLKQTNGILASEPNNFEEAAQIERMLGCWLDRARFALVGGSDRPHLAHTYTQLFQKITTHREHLSQQFADCLVKATVSHDLGRNVIPVEGILSTMIAPIAAQQFILLIVMDGMSLSIAITLLEELSSPQSDWQLLQPKTSKTPITLGLATIPSDTKTSRSSLLSGRLCQGNADHEAKVFTQSANFTKRRRGHKPPILFHKADLRDDAQVNLASNVNAAIHDPKQSIVGVVVNAIDDHLDKGEQTDISWSVETIKSLAALLQAAKESHRIVCLTSDHGHVLDHAARYVAATGGERWRVVQDSELIKDYERKITGDRVLGSSDHTLITPWTETVRYTKKKHGYHGGINPQEMLVAIALLCPKMQHHCPDGYQVGSLEPPEWWQLQSKPPVA